MFRGIRKAEKRGLDRPGAKGKVAVKGHTLDDPDTDKAIVLIVDDQEVKTVWDEPWTPDPRDREHRKHFTYVD